jgi:hypothetical protein
MSTQSEFHSIPEALAAEIQQLADQLSPQLEGSRQSEHEISTPAIHRALLEVARSSPELFAATILGVLGVDGVAVRETRETSEFRYVQKSDGGYRYSQLIPFEATQRVTREARLIRPHREHRT